MSLIQYEPISALTRLRNQLNNIYWNDLYPADDDGSNIATSRWSPSVDIKEMDDCFVILADVPGVDPDAIEVTAENGMLSIRGERKTESEEEREGFKRIERSRGSFYRRFGLPESADTDNIKATSKDGVLELTIPKSEKVQAKRIKVNS